MEAANAAASSSASYSDPNDKIATQMNDVVNDLLQLPKDKLETEQKSIEEIEYQNIFAETWKWHGSIVKTKGSKVYYQEVRKGWEFFKIDDTIVLTPQLNHKPYIGKIVEMWEENGNKIVKTQWYFRHDDITKCPVLKYPNSVFESSVVYQDTNDVLSIVEKCQIVSLKEFKQIFGKDRKKMKKCNNIFYLAGKYNYKTKECDVSQDIPLSL